MTTDLGIGSPPDVSLPTKEELLFPACATSRCAECIGESATQRCNHSCHEDGQAPADEAPIQGFGETTATDTPQDESTEKDPTSGEELVEVVEIYERSEAGILEHTRTIVDGTEAIIKRTPEPPRLVEPGITELIHDLVKKDEKIAKKEDEIDKLKVQLKTLNTEREEIIQEIKRSDGRTEQLKMEGVD